MYSSKSFILFKKSGLFCLILMGLIMSVGKISLELGGVDG